MKLSSEDYKVLILTNWDLLQSAIMDCLIFDVSGNSHLKLLLEKHIALLKHYHKLKEKEGGEIETFD